MANEGLIEIRETKIFRLLFDALKAKTGGAYEAVKSYINNTLSLTLDCRTMFAHAATIKGTSSITQNGFALIWYNPVNKKRRLISVCFQLSSGTWTIAAWGWLDADAGVGDWAVTEFFTPTGAFARILPGPGIILDFGDALVVKVEGYSITGNLQYDLTYEELPF